MWFSELTKLTALFSFQAALSVKTWLLPDLFDQHGVIIRSGANHVLVDTYTISAARCRYWPYDTRRIFVQSICYQRYFGSGFAPHHSCHVPPWQHITWLHLLPSAVALCKVFMLHFLSGHAHDLACPMLTTGPTSLLLWLGLHTLLVHRDACVGLTSLS